MNTQNNASTTPAAFNKPSQESAATDQQAKKSNEDQSKQSKPEIVPPSKS
jgi:hypothetical protein